MIDLSFHSDIRPAKGNLLISDPFLNDDYFRRSVIYLCEHNEQGSYGFVLNNLMQFDMTQSDLQFPFEEAFFGIGGPVETSSLFFLHTLGDQVEESIPVEKDIYIGGNYETLIEALNKSANPEQQVRFFLGYSGWSAGQLEEELAGNSWVVIDNFDRRDLFTMLNEDLWREYLQRMGPKFRAISNFPIDPNQN